MRWIICGWPGSAVGPEHSQAIHGSAVGPEQIRRFDRAPHYVTPCFVEYIIHHTCITHTSHTHLPFINPSSYLHPSIHPFAHSATQSPTPVHPAYSVMYLAHSAMAPPQHEVIAATAAQRQQQQQQKQAGAAARITDIRRQKLAISLEDEIVKGLTAKGKEKTMPTLLLYSAEGLKLFEDITYLEEYYLTNTEISILEKSAQDMAARVQDGSVVVELGSGWVVIIPLLGVLGQPANSPPLSGTCGKQTSSLRPWIARARRSTTMPST